MFITSPPLFSVVFRYPYQIPGNRRFLRAGLSEDGHPPEKHADLLSRLKADGFSIRNPLAAEDDAVL
jgi:hypothetical protein